MDVGTGSVGQTLRYELAGTLLVLVHGERSPADTDWDDYTDALRAHAHEITGVLVATDGAGPDGRQRVKLNDLVRQRGGSFPTAVVTGSVVARGIVTALGWFNPKLRAFAPAELADAVVYLGADPQRCDDLASRITRMRTALAKAEAGVY
jgi:hypothetical protein